MLSDAGVMVMGERSGGGSCAVQKCVFADGSGWHISWLRAWKGESPSGTVPAIAHRLSTVRHCDRILVVDGGAIAEEGTYGELLAKDGLFAELVKRQRLDTGACS